MMDLIGKQLLEMMSLKPIPEASIEKMKDNSQKSTFVDLLSNIQDKRVMKVFGKRAAEEEAIILYQKS